MWHFLFCFCVHFGPRPSALMQLPMKLAAHGTPHGAPHEATYDAAYGAPYRARYGATYRAAKGALPSTPPGPWSSLLGGARLQSLTNARNTNLITK